MVHHFSSFFYSSSCCDYSSLIQLIISPNLFLPAAVVFPSTIELQERMRAAHGGVYIGGDPASAEYSAASTQTCTTCDTNEEQDHTCLHSHTMEARPTETRPSEARQRKLSLSHHASSNGPLQDVPDLML